MDADLADLLADNPRAALHALNCADARDSLHAYCGMIEIPGAPVGEEPDEAADLDFEPVEGPPAAHHRALLDLCERLERGETRRAMVFMPPGSAKSTYASVVFPSWYMGKRKRRNVILGTYGTDLARKMGRRMRAIIRQRAYHDVFGVGLDPESRAADEFALSNGNEFMGGGLLSGITGNRADGIVVDDPFKNRQDADSETIRQRTADEFDDTVRTRLKPNGWVLMILTRWHEDDLAGRILPDGWDGESGRFLCKDGLEWEVLCIQAEAGEGDPLGRAPGEMLWPEWFGLDPDMWTAARSNPRTWSALYQQRPSPLQGTFFQRHWFRRYRPADIEGLNLRKYLSSDHAPTDGEDSDPTTCRVWGVDQGRDLYLIDGFSHRATMDITADMIVGNLRDQQRDPDRAAVEGLIRKHKPFAWFPEDDNNWKSVAGFVRRRMREEGVMTRIEPISPHGGDKAAKAQAFQGMAAMGRVFIPVGPEGDAIIDQFVKFPAAAHDEEVDCAGIIGRAIDMAHPAIVQAPKPAPVPVGVREATFDQMLANQRPADERIR